VKFAAREREREREREKQASTSEVMGNACHEESLYRTVQLRLGFADMCERVNEIQLEMDRNKCTGGRWRK